MNRTVKSKHPKKMLIGVIHLKPLPGSPNFAGDFEKIQEKMLTELDAYLAGEADAIIIENYYDVPFFKDKAASETIAAMTRLGYVAKQKIGEKALLGINILRNASHDSLAVATLVNADFIRVNILTGAMLTDQGIIENKAAELLRYRKGLFLPPVKLFADIQVKHAAPLAERSLIDEIDDAIRRSCADGVIISGKATGSPPTLQRVKTAFSATKILPQPLLIGSGMNLQNIEQYLPFADGFIIGTAMKTDNHVDVEKVKQFASIIH